MTRLCTPAQIGLAYSGQNGLLYYEKTTVRAALSGLSICFISSGCRASKCIDNRLKLQRYVHFLTNQRVEPPRATQYRRTISLNDIHITNNWK